MPEVISSFSVPLRRGARKYDWNVLLNGRAYRLRKGRDYSCDTRSLRQQVYAAGAKLGVKVTVRTAPDGSYLELKAFR